MNSATMNKESDLKVFSTCPQSSDHDSADYRKRIIEVARWSEAHGCEGILVYTDNRIADPWLVAKMVSSFGFLYGRRIYLNMVAGGFVNDLTSLNDVTPHDRRYERLVEYTT